MTSFILLWNLFNHMSRSICYTLTKNKSDKNKMNMLKLVMEVKMRRLSKFATTEKLL